MKIVSTGEITIDHYPEQNISFIGGISLNFAVHSKRCGADGVSLVSCVGDDKGGGRVFEKLSVEGVDASHVAVLPGKTATCDIQVIDHAERVYPAGGYHQNVLADFRLNDRDFAFIRQHDILVAQFDHAQPESLFHQVMVELDFDGKRVADFGDWSDYGDDHDRLTSYLETLDLAFVSGSRTAIDVLLPFSRRFGNLIVVTLGADGSAALVDGRTLYQPARSVLAPVDSTGCGDAFQAAFTVTCFRGGSVEQALLRGATQAATVLQHYGAVG